ncbi:MAG: lipopolysaccharide kinase InaA family protein [Azoarcus sp.]|nr:lipopolysaccharide kinase InaA family protein [Azoarcus sp.]MDX9838528.1 lipopolysaccharide kinase InaA family protein [Azoarcus sp.]
MTDDRPDTPAPLLDAAALRMAGRQPPAAFRIRLEDGREVQLIRLLRVLPGKRVVGEAMLDGEHVLAKLFVDKRSARYWSRERAGITALSKAGIPTPAALLAQALPDGGHVLLTQFLRDARSLLEVWHSLPDIRPGAEDAIEALAPAFALLGQLHASSLTHSDLHFGNFLQHANRLLLIDGDAVQAHRETPLASAAAARDLAMLIAQLPRTWDGELAPLLDAYRRNNPHMPSPAEQAGALRAALAWRLRDYLDKTGRDCSLFSVTSRFRRFEAVLRSERKRLAPLLDDIDASIEAGTLLKRGNTCTVARVLIGTQPVVVKRYNLKNLRHALSRLWRPSRGWHSWREGHRLRLFGIPTPAPLALVEERWGPLRGRAWLITEHCPGIDLLTHLDPDSAPPPAEARALHILFATLYRERISHGDLKATNLLWDGADVQLIDLDAMQQHRSDAAHQRAWQRDRKRLLRNWPSDCALSAWLDTHLPAG